ncbi:hypothetical protein AS159_07440 [Thermotoga sp. Ku-13t]|uniref:hypothetical protein n=1 Tax=Thermotoga sp. Ku-13t TaxID=1755813 RepID=UPI0013EC4A5D|nr:hypothetical protein [Thermotoga sp. Ku-13t]KAF2957493.1 hypothetical protein AS159_07440 [Thermotoga sp. Ku-13t]
MPRRLAILLALLITLVSALYLDVYEYFRSRNLILKLENSFIKLEQYDENVEQKREYLAKLESTVQPRVTLKELENLSKVSSLSFSLQKDGTYLVEGTCGADQLVNLLNELLKNANLTVQLLQIEAKELVPVVTDQAQRYTNVNVKMVLKGVMLE